MQILLKKREAQQNTDYMMMAYKNVVDVFIGMYLSKLLCFPLNVFDIYIHCCWIMGFDTIYGDKMTW